MLLRTRITTWCTALTALLVFTGCHDSETVYETTETSCCSEETHFEEQAERFDYLVTVTVLDEHGIPIVGAAVDLIVSDAPELHLLGVTGSGGRASFTFYTQPGVVVSAIVNAPEYEETYLSVVTDRSTFEFEMVIGPRPL